MRLSSTLPLVFDLLAFFLTVLCSVIGLVENFLSKKIKPEVCLQLLNVCKKYLA